MAPPTFGNSQLAFTEIDELEGGAHALQLKQVGGERKRRRKTRRRTKRKSKRRTRRLKGKRTKDCVCIKCLCKKCKCKPKKKRKKGMCMECVCNPCICKSKRKSRRTKLRKQLKGGDIDCDNVVTAQEECKRCKQKVERLEGKVGLAQGKVKRPQQSESRLSAMQSGR